MTQMQAFIEKAKNDKALMAKLDALGVAGAEPDKIIALAAEYGFTITAEDYRQAAKAAGEQKTGELNEEDLEAAAGGEQGHFPSNPIISSECWFKHNGGSEMRNGAYRKKCQAFACTALVFGGEFTAWYRCPCWGSGKCIDGWHYESSCA